VDKKVLFACFLGFSIGVTFMNIPPALDVFMVAYKASYPRISLLIGALFWSHALMQLPTGMLADRIGIKRTLSMGLFCMGLGNLLSAVLPTIGVGVLGRVMAGIGTGLCGVTTMKWIALHAPGRKGGTYQGFFAGFFSFGSIFAYLLIPLIVKFGWQWAYILPGGMSLFLLGILFKLQEIPALPGSVPLSKGRVFWIREGWVLGLVHALSYGSLISLGNWLPSFLSEIWNKPSSLQFAWSGALIMLISGLGRFSGGFLLLKFKPLTIIHGSTLILSILFSGLFFIPSKELVLMMALLVGLFGSINFGAVFHLTSLATTSDSMASLMGLVNFVANMGAVVFTLLFGWVKGATGSFGLGFAILAFLGLMTFAVSQFLLHDRLAVKLEV
jgi:MFS family permease